MPRCSNDALVHINDVKKSASQQRVCLHSVSVVTATGSVEVRAPRCLQYDLGRTEVVHEPVGQQQPYSPQRRRYNNSLPPPLEDTPEANRSSKLKSAAPRKCSRNSLNDATEDATSLKSRLATKNLFAVLQDDLGPGETNALHVDQPVRVIGHVRRARRKKTKYGRAGRPAGTGNCRTVPGKPAKIIQRPMASTSTRTWSTCSPAEKELPPKVHNLTPRSLSPPQGQLSTPKSSPGLLPELVITSSSSTASSSDGLIHGRFWNEQNTERSARQPSEKRDHQYWDITTVREDLDWLDSDSHTKLPELESSSENRQDSIGSQFARRGL